MRPESRASSGFSLIEVLIALSLTVLLMTLASQLMFSMKRSAERLDLQSDTRRTAEKAIDYLTMLVRGASDMHPEADNPTALMVWYNKGDTELQATYNNVADSTLADVGTDIITLARPIRNLRTRNLKWPGSANNASTAWWEFGMGCPDGEENFRLFKEYTGYNPDTGMSDPILISDSAGNYAFYQITNYKDSDSKKACDSTPPEMHVVANPGKSDQLNPPGGHPELNSPPIWMHLGVQYNSFRVRNGNLEQKNGIFDPTTDNPGTAFVPILPNVDDFQVAWIFANGEILNTGANALATTNNVPLQGSTSAYDVVNVVGMRISLTARSNKAIWGLPEDHYMRPTVEDHDPGSSDRFYRHQVSTLAMLRNRNLSR